MLTADERWWLIAMAIVRECSCGTISIGKHEKHFLFFQINAFSPKFCAFLFLHFLETCRFFFNIFCNFYGHKEGCWLCQNHYSALFKYFLDFKTHKKTKYFSSSSSSLHDDDDYVLSQNPLNWTPTWHVSRWNISRRAETAVCKVIHFAAMCAFG